jgi:hypothetical protein
MSETSEKQDFFKDHLLVRHPKGQSEKFPLPEEKGAIIRIGRELDNEIVLTDPLASRYHAEIRLTAGNNLEIQDLGSANGTQVGVKRIEPNSWEEMRVGQTVQLGETRLNGPTPDGAYRCKCCEDSCRSGAAYHFYVALGRWTGRCCSVTYLGRSFINLWRVRWRRGNGQWSDGTRGTINARRAGY